MPQSASTSSMPHSTQSHFAQPTQVRSPSLPCGPTQGRGRTQCVGWELSLGAGRKLKGSTGTSCMGWPISCYPFISTPLRIGMQQHTYFKSNFCSKLRLSQTGMTHRLWLVSTVTENIILIKKQNWAFIPTTSVNVTVLLIHIFNNNNRKAFWMPTVARHYKRHWEYKDKENY